MNAIKTLKDLALCADYSFVEKLTCNPKSKEDGIDYNPRQVTSGHYVLVKPTRIENPQYITHSQHFFDQLGLDQSLAQLPHFMEIFSGNLTNVPLNMKNVGWATGYALSIYGTEYYAQCPFQNGNGYGDGRAISIFEGVFKSKRWEMQLKGGGKTPYCRGADGRAVLRSSIREFLAQEHMDALAIPTSRSLTLYTSSTEKVKRPWYSPNSYAIDPDRMVYEKVAISTRVASSFLRVGQLELFARRTRKQEHPKAYEELKEIVLHLIEREYSDQIDKTLPFHDKVIALAYAFRARLTALVANWVRVGYCQGNFNSDNCAAGGFTLDYGPFGFIDMFDPNYQPWTGGGNHFAFFNQPMAAEQNFYVFFTTLQQLLKGNEKSLLQLQHIGKEFSNVMYQEMEKMWTSKLGLKCFNLDLYEKLEMLLEQSGADFTIFFRELSSIPNDITPLKKSFYPHKYNQKLDAKWSEWLEQWRSLLANADLEEISKQMKKVNPKYTLREWILVPAYRQAQIGDYMLLKELQSVMTDPYSEQTKDIEEKYYALKPVELFEVGGISHISCSS